MAETGARVAELWGASSFPAAIARKDGALPDPMPLEPTMFYTWVFDCHATDYVPVAAHHSREEADAYLAQRKEAWAAAYGGAVLSGAVIELTFRDFIERAVDNRLKELAEPLRAMERLDARRSSDYWAAALGKWTAWLIIAAVAYWFLVKFGWIVLH